MCGHLPLCVTPTTPIPILANLAADLLCSDDFASDIEAQHLVLSASLATRLTVLLARFNQLSLSLSLSLACAETCTEACGVVCRMSVVGRLYAVRKSAFCDFKRNSLCVRGCARVCHRC